jgi:hypothetical protein
MFVYLHAKCLLVLSDFSKYEFSLPTLGNHPQVRSAATELFHEDGQPKLTVPFGNSANALKYLSN